MGRKSKKVDTHPESIIFGTSATPVRTDGVNTIDELFEGNCVSNLSLSESIAKRIVPLPKYVGALYTFDEELEKLREKVKNATNTSEEKQDFYKKINVMRSKIEKSYGMPIILNKNIKDKEGRYIIFCKNKKHLMEIKETVIGWFRTAGCKNINAYIVHSSYENKDTEYKAFCNDTSHSLKLLFCVNMLNEGLHLENISGVLLLRPTKSMIVFLQQIGRAIEVNNISMPVIIDAVNNFLAVGQGMKLLKEIKDAVAKEKENNPNFDDSSFDDIDTFFVLEQVIEIQEMFKEIEERLQDDFENGLKHLDKYISEHNGDVIVPRNYVDEDSFALGNWVHSRRSEYKNKKLLTSKILELEKRNFVWDVLKYNFEVNIKFIAEYYNKYGKYPSNKSKDSETKRLGSFLNNEKIKMRDEKINYPEWKMQIINKYFQDFCCETRSDNSFNTFIDYVLQYKEKYGHADIKQSDVINNYKIGKNLSHIKVKYKNSKLSENQIKKLNSLGVHLGNKPQKQFDFKLNLAKQAVKNGTIISNANQIFEGENLYKWVQSNVKRKYRNNDLRQELIIIIEKLCGKPIYEIFNNHGKFIKVFDVKENTEIGTYNSYSQAAKFMREKFNLKINASCIGNHLLGKITTPYKNRFMFYSVDEVEAKKLYRKLGK